MRPRHAAIALGLLLAAALYVVVLDRGFSGASQPAPLPAAAAASAPVPVRQALPVLSAHTLQNSGSADWVVGRLDSNADVVAIVFAQLSEQALAMNRLAAYAEKAGAPRDRVLSDAELAASIARSGDVPQTYYLGHDYRLEKVASFFNQAQLQQLVLLPQEQRLLATLLAAGLLVQAAPAQEPAGASYQVAQAAQALITVSQLAPADRLLLQLSPGDKALGAAVVAHEISHGDFLTRPAYQQQSWRFWQSVLHEDERQQWRRLLQRMDYDLGNEELLVNEVQALLMHTPDARVFGPVHLLISSQALALQRKRFALAGKAAGP